MKLGIVLMNFCSKNHTLNMSGKIKCFKMNFVVYNVLHNVEKFEVNLNCGLKEKKIQSELCQNV